MNKRIKAMNMQTKESRKEKTKSRIRSKRNYIQITDSHHEMRPVPGKR